MPLALDPKQRFKLVLKSDQFTPSEKQPRFVFHFLSGRQWKEAAAIDDQLAQGGSGVVQGLSQVCAALRIGLVDWENMIDGATGQPIPYDPADLDRIINLSEAFELLYGMMDRMRLDTDDKKKFESPSPSATAAAAAIAPAG